MSKEYRTQEQWETMCENAVNGNWSDAAQNAVDFGFYANDMIHKYNEEEECCHILSEESDIAIIAEMAAGIRG